MRSRIKREFKVSSLDSFADTLFFMCEIAAWMLREGKMSISLKNLPPSLVRRCENVPVNGWRLALEKQTMLPGDNRGNYAPTHRSLIEFFAAYKLVAELSARGLEVVEARAESLPFADASFDWVTIRHVSHHLADERSALAEAFRVARQGVLVAEPWLDESIEEQRVARRFDAWLVGQSTRVGDLHRAALTAGDFLAAVPTDVDVEAEFEHFLILGPRPTGCLEAEAAPFLDDLPADAPARRELAEIEAAAKTVGLGHNGTLILSLRHRGGSAPFRGLCPARGRSSRSW